jgi:TM2 domain-containing membrane protein YozV
MTGPTHHPQPARWETYPGQAAYPAHPIQPGYPVQASYAVQPIHPVQPGYPAQPAYPIPYPATYGGYAPVTPPKSSGVAYLLWFFLGGFGVHHFYLDRPAWGAAYIALNVLGWATAIFLVGFVLLIPLWILLLVDLFMIPSYTQTANVRFITYR